MPFQGARFPLQRKKRHKNMLTMKSKKAQNGPGTFPKLSIISGRERFGNVFGVKAEKTNNTSKLTNIWWFTYKVDSQNVPGNVSGFVNNIKYYLKNVPGNVFPAGNVLWRNINYLSFPAKTFYIYNIYIYICMSPHIHISITTNYLNYQPPTNHRERTRLWQLKDRQSTGPTSRTKSSPFGLTPSAGN